MFQHAVVSHLGSKHKEGNRSTMSDIVSPGFSPSYLSEYLSSEGDAIVLSVV